MRPSGVVVGNPSGDDFPSLVEIEKQALVEKFVAHPAVESFDVAVLHRFAGCDVVPFHLMLFAPAQDRVRGELGTVVGYDHLRLAAALDQRRETSWRGSHLPHQPRAPPITAGLFMETANRD
jgi:hypothetical protein